MTAHVIAIALLLGIPKQVRPEQESRPETIEVVVAIAMSEPEAAHSGPVGAEPATPSSAVPAPKTLGTEPAEAAPLAAPLSSPIDESAPAAPDAVPAPSVQTPPAPLPVDPPPVETSVAPVLQPEAKRLSTAVPPSASPSNLSRRPASPLPKPALRRPVAPGSSFAARDESATGRPDGAPGSTLSNMPAPLASLALPSFGSPVIDPGWRGELGAWMRAHRRYPDAARDRDEEGTVGVAFTVSRDGAVLAVQVVHSSGSARLDQAVHDMLAGQNVPAFPAAMTQAQAQIVVNVRFSLDR